MLWVITNILVSAVVQWFLTIVPVIHCQNWPMERIPVLLLDSDLFLIVAEYRSNCRSGRLWAEFRPNGIGADVEPIPRPILSQLSYTGYLSNVQFLRLSCIWDRFNACLILWAWSIEISESRFFFIDSCSFIFLFW